MLFSKTIKLLICLVILIPYIVQAPQASASVNYDHNALAEYKGYGQAMYETIVDQTTFVTGQYTDNKQYVKESMGQIKDYANFWLNEQGTIHDACSGTQIFTKNCLGELVSSGAGYALTVGDFIKNLFTDYEKDKVLDNTIHPLASYFEPSSIDPSKIQIIPEHYFTINNETQKRSYLEFARQDINMTGGYGFDYSVLSQNFRQYIDRVGPFKTSAERDAESMNYYNLSRNVNAFLSKINGAINIRVYKIATNEEMPSLSKGDPTYTTIKKYIDNGARPIIAPQPKAYLSCPDGTRIDMAINGATFLDATGQVMNVNKDGTAQISSQICNLGWEKQQVDYVDDKAAITDPDGNWLDIATGELLECVLLEKCEVSKPPSEIEPIDNSLIEYVKNAYEYATGVLKTATDGLKSLGTGAKELTALFGIFFSWLPREMVVLMSSGLMLVIGLRLFRK